MHSSDKQATFTDFMNKLLASRPQIPNRTEKNFFSGLEIYFKGLEIYFSAAEIYFQATEIVLSKAATNFTCRGGGEYTMKRRKTNNETEEKSRQSVGRSATAEKTGAQVPYLRRRRWPNMVRTAEKTLRKMRMPS